MFSSSLDFFKDTKKVIVLAVYLALFLDNILLTVVVPIIPDYLFFTEKKDAATRTFSELQQNLTKDGGILGPYFGVNSLFAKVSRLDDKNNNLAEKNITKRSSKLEATRKNAAEYSRMTPKANTFEKRVRIKRAILKKYNGIHSVLNLNKRKQILNVRRQPSDSLQSKDRLLVNYVPNDEDNYLNVINFEDSDVSYNIPEENKDVHVKKLIFIKPGKLETIDPKSCSNHSKQIETNSPVTADTQSLQGQLSPPVELALEENGRVGILLASKALVQIAVNPLVGLLTSRLGYHLPLFMGSVSLLAAALIFAFGERYSSLLLARSLQGVASACIGVSGMCLVAEQYPEEGPRSKVMGVVLGSIALGVLLGYPFGSLLYDFVGKTAPFIIIAFFVLLNGVLQLFVLDLKTRDVREVSQVGWCGLLSDYLVLITAGAILLSTSAMAILEPCLPIWLMDNVKPEKWQLGTVFIPDSLGYLIGTNCFGMVAYRLGRWRIAIMAMILIGLAAMAVPSAGGVAQLAAPHFGIGLGIGVVDAALVPLLANLVDMRYSAHYGSVYALQQTAVSLAYFLGPLAGGELVRAIGFPWLMRSLGVMILLYCPLLVLIGQEVTSMAAQTSLLAQAPFVTYNTEIGEDVPDNNNLYRRFVDADSD